MATQMDTTTPVRDELVGILQALMDDLEDLSDGCCACIVAPSGWCDPHIERSERFDRLEATDRRLWAVKTDTEALAVVAGLKEPAVTEYVARVTGMSERAVSEVLDIAEAQKAVA